MRYPVILFDVGETLIGPGEPFGATYARVLAGFGLDVPVAALERAIRETAEESAREIPPGIDRYRHYAGGEAEYWLRFSRRAVSRATGRSADDAIHADVLHELREGFRRREAWELFADVVPALEALRAGGVRLGIVSNWDSRLPAVLELLDLTRHFDAIGVSHLEGVEKPDPRIFERVLDRMGATPQQTLHVGDLPECDAAGARAAGIDCLLIDRRGRLTARDARPPAVPVVQDLRGLPEVARVGLAAA